MRDTMNQVAQMVTEMTGYTAEVVTILRNNGTERIGIKFGEDSISPIIYPTEEELSTLDAEKIAKHLVEQYRYAVNKTPVINQIIVTSKAYILKNVYWKLIGTDANKELLQDIPSKQLCDMSAVYRVTVMKEDDQEGSYQLTNQVMEHAGLTLEEVDKAAMENTRKFGCFFTGMQDMIEELALGTKAKGKEITEISTGELYVLTNDRKIFGSAIILYNDILEQISKVASGEYFILPSSVHEVLIIKPMEGSKEVSELRNIVNEINASQVAPDEVLTGNVYRYNPDKKELEIA